MSAPRWWHCRFALKAPGGFSLEAEPAWPRDLPCRPSLAVFERPGAGEIEGEIFFDEKPEAEDLGAIERALARHFGQSLPPLRPAPVAKRDWLAEGRKALRSVRAGCFLVFSRANRPAIPKGAIPLEIEAGLAFGTGHHETTRGCLLALQSLKGSLPPKICLDLGCGSGILAGAMAKLWPKAKILASDSDPEAIVAARRTFRTNRLPKIQTLLAGGFAHRRLGHAKFDLIAANLLAGPLIELAADFAARLASHGVLIVSGILKTQEPEVRTAFANAGLKFAARHFLGEWPTLVFKR